ncbi:hypothetical protein [Amycolatopsis minnesotensis]|uniref:hypothetical protein n=1 Tax=Amycolatopsis minnesotensis TaxID=337894 RepID=UPI0031E33EC3
MTQLEKVADTLPAGEAVLDRARTRVRQAARIVSAAVQVDPTLLDDRDYARNHLLDLCVELVRQLQPLARQAFLTLEHARLTKAGAPQEEFARIGRINPLAPDELDALSERLVELAKQIDAAALPDWNTPRRIRERSERLLPGPKVITRFADQLAEAVRPAADLPYPAAMAVEVAALAEQLRTIADRPTAAEDQIAATYAAPGIVGRNDR